MSDAAWMRLADGVVWMLVQSIWQFAALAVVFALATRWVETPRARHAWGMALLACVPLVAVVTFIDAPIELRVTASGSLGAGGGDASSWRDTVGASSARTQGPSGESAWWVAASGRELLASARGWTKWAALVWGVVASMLVLRVARRGLAGARLRDWHDDPSPRSLAALVGRAARDMGLRRSVPVFVSTRVDVPAVVGVIKTAVLIPASAITGLSTQQLELVVRHEIAHIARRDAIWNVVQSVIESVWFYHPAVWWISRAVRNEREAACDDLAAPSRSEGRVLAEALYALERRRRDHRLVMALDGGVLRGRIARLVTGRPSSRHAVRRDGRGGQLIVATILTCSAFFARAPTPASADTVQRIASTSEVSVRHEGAQLDIVGETGGLVMRFDDRVESRRSTISDEQRRATVSLATSDGDLCERVLVAWETQLQSSFGILDLFAAEPVVARIEIAVVRGHWREAILRLRQLRVLLINNFASTANIAAVTRHAEACRRVFDGGGATPRAAFVDELHDILNVEFERRLSRLQ